MLTVDMEDLGAAVELGGDAFVLKGDDVCS